MSALDGSRRERKDSTHGKYETKYDTSATHCIAPQTSVPRYECFCTRSGAQESVLGVRRFRGRVRTCHQGEDQGQDERAKVGGRERQALGGEDVLEVGDGALQHAESAGDERIPMSWAFIGLPGSPSDLPDHEENLVWLRVRVCQLGD